MLTLLNLITCARQSGQWAACRLMQLRSASSQFIHTIRSIDRRASLDPCRLPAPVPIPVHVPRLSAFTLVPALLLAALAVSPAAASRGIGYEAAADGRLVDVQVQVDGREVPLYLPTDGSDRHYFQAFKGRHYALVLTNNSGRRIGVLIAVDGLNVVNGERSSLSSGEPMYVLDPWEKTTIRGWRSSLEHTRRFVFVDEDRSYAERTGQANGDLGWVRVMAFRERGQQWFRPLPGRIDDRERGQKDGEERPYGSLDEQRSDKPMARREAPEAGAAPQSRQQADPLEPRENGNETKSLYGEGGPQAAPSVPGTGWGQKQWDPVRRVWFVPEAYATDQIVLRYEYAAGLRALGIFPGNVRNRLWERERGELGFAPPPRW